MTQQFLPYAPERDIYRLLGVDPAAGDEELMEAWRRLARTFHPDRNMSTRSHEEMQVVNALRELIANPEARARYDRERSRWMAARVRRPRGVVPGASAPSARGGRGPRSSESPLPWAPGFAPSPSS